jgi:hypothetical protein
MIGGKRSEAVAKYADYALLPGMIELTTDKG